jgi:hypothetical protein
MLHLPRSLARAVVALVALAPAAASAQEQEVVAPRSEPVVAAPAVAAIDSHWPKLGGHFNLAIPIVTFGTSSPTTVIGEDFGKLGLAPGVTVKLDEHWMVDFEFVAYSNFKGSNLSEVVIDPGVLYNFGPLVAGLRTAVAVGGGNTQNWGFIPIVVKTVPLGRVSLLFELDFPIFIRETQTTFTLQPQIGTAF